MQRKIVRYFIYSVLFIFINGFIQKPISRIDESCIINCPIIEKHKKYPFIAFSDKIEIFDSSNYHTERYMIYKALYAFFEKNPINFKSLNKGLMILHFKKIDSYDFRFDSIENCNSKQNAKVMNLFAKSFSSPAYTDSNKIIIPIFIRRSNAFSMSIDTLDIMNSKNMFNSKTEKGFVEKGILSNNKFVLDSLLKPYYEYKLIMKDCDPCRGFENENANYSYYENDWKYYLERNLIIPESIKNEEFECQIKIAFKVDKSGRVSILKFFKINKDNNPKIDLLLREMENELNRVFEKKEFKWDPKTYYDYSVSSQYTSIFTLKFEYE